MSEIIGMLQDEREISAVWFLCEDGGGYSVGTVGTTKIAAYGEPGHMASIPFIAVYGGDELLVRIPATAVSVHYKAREASHE